MKVLPDRRFYSLLYVLILSFIFCFVKGEEQVLFVLEIFRSGVRPPILAKHDRDPDTLPGEVMTNSEILNIGLRQHFETGIAIASRYKKYLKTAIEEDNLEFLGFENQECELSALGQAIALYSDQPIADLESSQTKSYSPPVDLSKVEKPSSLKPYPIDIRFPDVKTFSAKENLMFNTETDAVCPLLARRITKLEPFLEEKYGLVFSSLYDDLRKNTFINGIFSNELNQIDLKKAALICDYVIVQYYSNHQGHLDSNLVHSCIQFMTFTYYLSGIHAKRKLTILTPLNKYIVNQIQEKLNLKPDYNGFVDWFDFRNWNKKNKNKDNDNTKAKFLLVAGVDNTIAHLLINFIPKNYECIASYFINQIPTDLDYECVLNSTFGENLIIEVFKKMDDKTMFVRLLRNGEVFKMFGENSVTLDSFISTLKSNIETRFDVHCEARIAINDHVYPELLNLLFFSIFVMVMMIFLIIFISVRNRKRREEFDEMAAIPLD